MDAGQASEKMGAERPFERMEDEGVPKADAPSEQVAKPTPAEDKKLSPADYRVYNRMAEHMDMFHNHFRHEWTTLHTASTTGARPAGMSIRGFLGAAERFCASLTTHHTIEERYIFPVLAQRMPAFRAELELLDHHRRIHVGVDRMEEYIRECRGGERELRLEEMKGIMDSFGGVLWEHLDAEVKELGAENMSKYWSLDDMRRMPM